MQYGCDSCNAGCHKNCVGEVTKGYGEYPDEDSYSYCKKCVKKEKKTYCDYTAEQLEQISEKKFETLIKCNNINCFCCYADYLY